MSAFHILMIVLIAAVLTVESTKVDMKTANLTALQSMCAGGLPDVRAKEGFFDDLKGNDTHLPMYIFCSYIELYTEEDLMKVERSTAKDEDVMMEFVKVEPSKLFENIGTKKIAEQRCDIAVAGKILRKEITDDAKETQAYAKCDDIKKLPDDTAFGDAKSFNDIIKKVSKLELESNPDASCGRMVLMSVYPTCLFFFAKFVGIM